VRSILRILGTARELWPYYVGIIGTSLAMAATTLSIPFILKAATDYVVAASRGQTSGISTAIWLAAALLAADLVNSLLTNVGGYLGDTMAVKLRAALSGKYFAKLLSLPQKYFDGELTGTVINRLSRSITETANFLNMFANSLFQMVLTVIAILAITAYYSWPMAVLLAVLLGGLISLDLVQPQIVRFFIDAAQAGGAPGAMSLAALLYLGVALLTQVIGIVEGYTAANLGWLATNALRADLTQHCLELDLSFHNSRTPGELIERLDGDVTVLANFFSRFVLHVVGNGLLLAGVLVLVFREDRRIGLVLLAFSILALLVMNGFRNPGARFAAASRQAVADLFGYLEERLNGLPDIQTAGAQEYVLRGLSSRLLATIRGVLGEGLEEERQRRVGGLPAKLGDHWIVHKRSGTPCPVCGADLRRVSFESHEITYCPSCQTGGKILADRRMSRLLK